MAKLECGSFIHAQIVQKVIESMLECDSDSEKDNLLFYSPFINGREMGLCFTNYGQPLSKRKFVYVCENRNSDNLTITVSTTGNEWKHDITEEDYKNRMFFEPNDYVGVAQKVLELIY